MKSFRILLVAALSIVIGLASCSKTGDTGPAGPTGPQGPAGPQSVYSSPWIELVFDDTNFDDTLSAPTITKEILDSGVILSYLNVIDQDGVYHLWPMAALNADFYEEFSVGSIYIAEIKNDYEGLQYRYVTIPGALITTNGSKKMYKGYTIEEMKSMSFDKVKTIVSGNSN